MMRIIRGFAFLIKARMPNAAPTSRPMPAREPRMIQTTSEESLELPECPVCGTCGTMRGTMVRGGLNRIGMPRWLHDGFANVKSIRTARSADRMAGLSFDDMFFLA